MPTAKVKLTKPDGATETVEVEVADITLPEGHTLNTPDAPADGYVTKAFADADKQQAIQGRLSNHVHREKAAEDDQVVQAVLAKHGKADVDLDAHRKQWEEEHLAPLRQAHDGLQRQVSAAQLIEAGRKAGVKEEYLEGGENSFLVYRLGGQLEHDADHGFVAKGDDGKRLPGREGRAFANAEDLLSTVKGQDGFGSMFKEQTPQKGGSRSGDGGSGLGTITKKSDLKSTEDKVAFVREHGNEAFESLPA